MAKVRLGRNEIEEERLPMACMCCGAKAESTVTRKFSWYPPWIVILLFFGLCPFVIVALILTKRMTVGVPLCHLHKNHWSWRNWLSVLTFLGLVGLGGGATFLSAQMQAPGGQNYIGAIACGGVVVLGVAWFVMVAIVQLTAIGATEITDRSITLKGVSESFVNTLQEFRESTEEEEVEKAGPEEYDEED
jgi:hypothetical protein